MEIADLIFTQICGAPFLKHQRHHVVYAFFE